MHSKIAGWGPPAEMARWGVMVITGVRSEARPDGHLDMG